MSVINTDDEVLLPGEDLIRQGLTDLAQGQLTDCSLLILIAAPQLKRLGISVPDTSFLGSPEHQLYENLENRLGPGAHSYYNSLLRRVTSYIHVLENEQPH
jgi:hypothetical protein